MIDPADARPDARTRRSRRNRQFFGGRATAGARAIGGQPSRSGDGDDARRSAVRPLDEDADPDRAGAAIVGDARAIIASARALRARAQSIAEDLEPELTLAVDATFPMPLLMESLGALRGGLPKLPATVFTEALGEARRPCGAARPVWGSTRRAARPRTFRPNSHHVALVPVVAATIRWPGRRSRSAAKRWSPMCNSC